MGDPDVSTSADSDQQRGFVKALLDDVRALERMLETGMIESGVRRIGAEQEMFLVDEAMRPTGIADRVLASANDERLTTELGRFNIEANLSPRLFGGACLSEMEAEMREVVELTRRAAADNDAHVVLCGILPTLRHADLSLDNMTKLPRYAELNRVMKRMRGDDFHIVIKGTDEIDISHDNVMLESCNTSFQIHFQVSAAEFAPLYNLAQAITGPVLAASVNSPVLFGSRLWHETRIALFQHSVDTRTKSHKARQTRARVSFGEKWVDESVLEIFREDIARFRSILAKDVEIPDPLDMVARGEAPDLDALKLHNGTVYRWNRACYGVGDGKPHLRIEHRLLPSGPSIVDEVANAAFFFGLMSGMASVYPDIRTAMSFDDAKANFQTAARHGLESRLRWVDGREHAAPELIRRHLIPIARQGLRDAGVDHGDIDRFLGVLDERVARKRTGSQWLLDSYARFDDDVQPQQRARTLTSAMIAGAETGNPVHRWPLAGTPGRHESRHDFLTVGQFMTTDLFTLHPEDLVDLAASVMDWEHIRHVPVEDEDGHLVGLVSHRALLRMIAHGGTPEGVKAVRDIMRKDPVTITPETPTLNAMQIMRERRVGCLPVLNEDERLVGIVTERDLIGVSTRLLEKYLKGE
jgi:CBS domain-containing protein/gamma-glutamyl:cysteine ligase YbdK (ATP-grasp superfamily)